MKRLEVSGAVRLIYGSFGVKRLMEVVKKVKTAVLKCVILKSGILRHQGLETLNL